MSRYKALQFAAPAVQQATRADQSPHQPVTLLTEAEAARHARYFDRGLTDPVRSFQKVARRLGIPVKRIGRTRLYDPAVLDAFMDRKAWTRRHRQSA